MPGAWEHGALLLFGYYGKSLGDDSVIETVYIGRALGVSIVLETLSPSLSESEPDRGSCMP